MPQADRAAAEQSQSPAPQPPRISQHARLPALIPAPAPHARAFELSAGQAHPRAVGPTQVQRIDNGTAFNDNNSNNRREEQQEGHERTQKFQVSIERGSWPGHSRGLSTQLRFRQAVLHRESMKPGPNQLQPGRQCNHGDNGLQFLRGNSSSRATKESG